MRRRRLSLFWSGALVLALCDGTRVAAAVCGNGVCESGEATSCPTDCGDENAIDVAGDSLSKGYNAFRAFGICANGDQENYNWATSNTHGSDWCGAGADGVFSHAERIECSKQADMAVIKPNSARTGASMRTDFLVQAQSIKANLEALAAPRYAPVFLGHNDICGGEPDKVPADACLGDPDRDPLNYCWTKPEAFEREFRKGLDVLITVPDLHIGIAAPFRVSQLCNIADATACQLLARKCSVLWKNALALGLQACGSLTKDCSPQRRVDTYLQLLAYRAILQAVTEEYASIPEGSASQQVTVGGQLVGGAVKSPGVALFYSDAAWKYRFPTSAFTCCDCAHFNVQGQQTLSRILFEGLTCGPGDVCCNDTGDPLADATCTSTDTSGTFYDGIY
jgi:hypothetical protein